MSPDLLVRGGTGGVAAQLEHLDLAVLDLTAGAAALGEVDDQLRVGRGLLEALPALLSDSSAVLALEGDLLSAGLELVRAREEASALAVAVATAVGLYRDAEAAGQRVWVVGLLGSHVAAAPLRWAVAPLLAPAVAGVGPVLRLGARVREHLAGPPETGAAAPVTGVAPEGVAGSGPGPGAGAGAGAAGGRVGVSLPTGALDGLFGAVGAVLVGGTGAVLAGSSTPVLARRVVGDTAARGYGDALGVTATPSPVPPAVAAAGPPRGVGDLLLRTRQVADTDTGAAGRVRVERVRQPDGTRAAVVYLPGVQDWDVDSRNAASSASALRGLGGGPSSYSDLAVRALERAGVQQGEPVLLVGHSLGGITAAAVASDPGVRERFTVTAVVTAGSPIGAVAVPPDVAVLALEHPDDVVPALDGRLNPAGPSTTTVTAPTPAWAGAHDSDGYAELGFQVDAADDPSLVAWRERAAPFLAGGGATSEVTEVVGRTVDPTPTS